MFCLTLWGHDSFLTSIGFQAFLVPAIERRLHFLEEESKKAALEKFGELEGGKEGLTRRKCLAELSVVVLGSTPFPIFQVTSRKTPSAH